MIFVDHRYFRELHAGSIEGIASNTLADRLKKLVAAAILSREDAARGARARYSLTEAGIQTLPIIFALGNWGLDWRDSTPNSAFAKNSCATKDIASSKSLWTKCASGTSTQHPRNDEVPGRSNDYQRRTNRQPVTPIDPTGHHGDRKSVV